MSGQLAGHFVYLALHSSTMKLTTEEAAGLAGVQPITIRQNIRRGNLKAEKRGRDWFIGRAELERWAATRGIQLGASES